MPTLPHFFKKFVPVQETIFLSMERDLTRAITRPVSSYFLLLFHPCSARILNVFTRCGFPMLHFGKHSFNGLESAG